MLRVVLPELITAWQAYITGERDFVDGTRRKLRWDWYLQALVELPAIPDILHPRCRWVQVAGVGPQLRI